MWEQRKWHWRFKFIRIVWCMNIRQLTVVVFSMTKNLFQFWVRILRMKYSPWNVRSLFSALHSIGNRKPCQRLLFRPHSLFNPVHEEYSAIIELHCEVSLLANIYLKICGWLMLCLHLALLCSGSYTAKRYLIIIRLTWAAKNRLGWIG